LFPVDAGQFVIPVYDISDFTLDQGFCFTDEAEEVVFVDVAGKHEVDDRAVQASGKLANKIYLSDLAKAIDNRINDGIKSNVFYKDVMDFLI
jgi:hypothetical protein